MDEARSHSITGFTFASADAVDRWRGRGRSPVMFEATVPEWSLDAVGRLVALFADACRHVGVETSVLVGVAR